MDIRLYVLSVHLSLDLTRGFQRASQAAQLVKNPPAMQETHSWLGKIPWRRERLRTPVFLGFPVGSDGKG